jgi:murein DD-endopeptidase MepM/ murein hydrolase activator NlpD
MRHRIGAFAIFFILLGLAVRFASQEDRVDDPTKPSRPPAAAPEPEAQDGVWSVSDTIQGIVVRGDRLDAILRTNGIRARTAYASIQALRNVFDPRRIRPGEEYRLELSHGVGLVRLVYQPAPEVLYVVERDSAETFSVSRRLRPLNRELQGLSGTIDTNLYDSMRALGAPAELVAAFADIFQWDIDFFVEPRAGDRFGMIYESFTLDSREVRLGKILAAEYVLRGRPLTAVYFETGKGKAGYYEPTGSSFQKTYLRSPLNYRRISSHFSRGRWHPILKVVRPHRGIDFVAPIGTPVVAAADGVVVETGFSRGGLGRFVKIRHKNPHHVTVYGHLNGFARGISTGVKVQQAQVIGYVGATGLATGPHLHYSFLENGRPIDPLRIENASGEPISERQWHDFVADRDSLMSRLANLPPLIHVTPGYPEPSDVPDTAIDE